MLVAFLLLLGVIQVWDQPWVVGVAAVFAAVYVVGTVWHNRGGRLSTTTAVVWLVVISALWVVLVWASPSFVWLLFPLVFLLLYVAPAPWGVVATFLAWVVAVVVSVPASGVAGAVGPGIGTVLAVVIYYSYQALKRETEHYRKLATRLAHTQEDLAEAQHQAGVMEERTRLSREIHDTLAQGFSSIVLLARAGRGSQGEAVVEALDSIEETAQDNLAQARALIRGETNTDLPLDQRVEHEAQKVRRRQDALGTPLDIRTSVAPNITGPAADVAAAVVREGLSNIARHAHATQAVITVDALPGQLTVDVFDNGGGMHTAPGYGLTQLRRRVEEAGGTFTVESSSSGTVLAASLPREVQP